MYDGFSGPLQRFKYIRETNPQFEVGSLLLTATLPSLVFKKRFLFSGAILEDFTISDWICRDIFVTISPSEHRTPLISGLQCFKIVY